MKRSLLALSLMATAAVLATGCTKAQPPRSFVQPNALRKADFTGVWYYNATVVDAPPTNSNVYEGEYGELQKIKWVITEDTLFAVRAYPFVYNQEDPQTPGSPHGNVDGANTYEGEPLAAWRIQSHFDIIRDYNPSTGEETNRIIESQERPWNEREYMRVDWSKNLAPDYTGIGLDLFFSGTEPTEISYYVSDPTSPDALHVERADDKDTDLGFQSGEMNYLDITAQLIVNPSTSTFVIDDQGNTMTFPSCFLYYGTEDCAAQKVKLRHAFAKMAPNDTYEKRRWDGLDQNKFGFFTTELRHFWDRQYGDTYSGAKRFVERFNFFTGSCKTPGTTCEAPHRVRDINDGTWLTRFTDQDLANLPTSNPNHIDGSQVSGRHLSEQSAIAAGLMSIVDPNSGAAVPAPDSDYYWEGTDGVPLTRNGDGSFSGDDNWVPYSQRQLRTIPYYANEEMPEQIWKDSKVVISQWNEVFKTAYTDLVGSPPPGEIFVWCHNPVHSDDPQACFNHLKPEVDANGNVVNGADGKPVYRVRQGDPRYSSILWLNQYQAGGPLGLGPAMADPETGETISSKANIYGGELDTYAAWARDLLLLLDGRVSTDQYINGVDLKAWVKAQTSNQGVASMPKGLSTEQIGNEASAMNFDWATGAMAGPVDHSSTKAFRQSLETREGNMSHVFGLQPTDLMQAKVDMLRNTPLEAELASTQITSEFGLDPHRDFGSLSPQEKSLYSPLNTPRLRTLRKQYLERLEAFGFDFEPFTYEVMQGEADRYKNRSPDDIYNELRDRIFIAVTLHEVGHNMGLRHNFRGSFDAMNYFPGYWEQREAAAAASQNPVVNGHPVMYARSHACSPTTTACKDGATKTEIGVAQPNELAPQQVNITEGPWAVTKYDPGEVSSFGQQYSSIMDYGAAFNSDMAGLGRYDIAAIKYGYANHVEVFTKASQDPAQLLRLSSLQVFQDAYGFPSALLNSSNFAAVNYYTFPQMMDDGAAGLQERTDVSAYAVDDRPFYTGGTSTDTVRAAVASDGTYQPEVPYYFCSDEFVGNLSCQRFDFGADAYEQAEDVIHRYQNWYPIRNFKKDQFAFHNFGLGGHYVDYTLDRYFEILRGQMTWYVLLRSDFTDQANESSLFGVTPAQLKGFFSDDQYGWGSFTAAMNDGFRLFGDVLQAPQAGSFILSKDDEGNPIYKQFRDDLVPSYTDPPPPSGDGVTQIFPVDINSGRYETTTWNFTGCGYYWGDECQTRIGYFLDKWMALYELGQSQAYFTGRDTSVDVRQYAIGYWLPYKNQILDFYGDFFSGDYSKLAPYYLGPNEGIAKRDFATGTWHDEAGDLIAAPSGPRIDPEAGFSMQMWAGVWGISGFSSTFDQGFIDSTRVFVVGNGEAPVPDSALLNPDGTPGPLATTDASQLVANGGTYQWYVFTDPQTAKTYAAHSVPPNVLNTYDPNTTSTTFRGDIAVRMLEHAGKLWARTTAAGVDHNYATTEYGKYVQQLDMLRSLHNAMGYGYYLIDQ